MTDEQDVPTETVSIEEQPEKVVEDIPQEGKPVEDLLPIADADVKKKLITKKKKITKKVSKDEHDIPQETVTVEELPEEVVETVFQVKPTDDKPEEVEQLVMKLSPEAQPEQPLSLIHI